MRSSRLSWSQSLINFLRPQHAHTRYGRKSLTRRPRRFESLEDRSVLTATFGSAIGIGGAEGERVMDLQLDSAGNTYVTGYFMGTADFDQGEVHPGDTDILTAQGGTDAFVAKYAPDNSLLWVRSLGGDAVDPGYITETGRSLAVDPYGDVLVTGEFWGSGLFGATELVSVGGADGFVTKLDTNGNIAWARSLGTSGFDSFEGVDVDAQSNVYLISSSSIQKLNGSGQLLWNKSTLANNNDVTVTASGSVYVVGSFTGKVDFDPGPKTKYVTTGTNSAAFVLKLDTNGNFGWVTPFMGSGTAFSSEVEVDGTGNVYASGRYTGAIDFDPSGKVSVLNSSVGNFITKLNSSGSLVWARGLAGGSYLNSLYGLAVDVTGNVYATGTFYSSIDLNPGAGSVIRTTTGTSDGDIFVVKLSSSGNYEWGETFGSTGLDMGYDIAVNSENEVVLGGTFMDSVDFDPSPLSEYVLSSAGGRDGFILRLSQS